MRLVTWNCRSGFQRKFDALLSLAPDVAIVSECCTSGATLRCARATAPSGALWIGDNPLRGLGVFAFGGLRVERDGAFDPRIKYALPVRVEGRESFNVLAIWAHYGLSGMRVRSAGPTLRALGVYADFLQERPAIVGGDLNNHVRWDRPGKAWNHANAVSRLAELGFVSAYHAFEQVEQGAERHPTFYWRTRSIDGPTYHIDYVFVPRRSMDGVRSVTIGSRADWIESRV